MLILLFLFGTFFSYTLAQSCSTPQGTREVFGNYLRCLKDELDADYKSYEDELRSDNRKAASHCFSPTIAEANAKDQCVLAPVDLEAKAWDRNGPLRDCSICRTFAQGAIKAILNTPEEDQKCIRVGIAKAIAREADFCIRKKISDHPGVPEIPDLEEGSFALKDEVITSISDHILIISRLSFCEDRKPQRAASTRSCLKNPFPGYLQKHCTALSKCDSNTPSDCNQRLEATKQATCGCINEAREDLKRRISGIADAIKDAITKNGRGAPAIGSSSKVDICVQNIKKQLITPVNDWGSVIDNTLSTCITNKPSGQSLGVDSLLNVGCRKVIADTTGTATTQLKTGFDFVNNLIDAMVDRAGRFCGGSHCH